MEERDNLVYDRFIIPVGLHYYGITNNLESRRQYKGTSLQQYIDEYEWDNINTTIVADGLTRKEAEQLENELIKDGWKRGDCINRQGSGGKERDNPVEYKKQYNKQYYDSHKEEILEYHKQYNQEHKDEKKQYNKQYKKQFNSTSAGKIYKRVDNYNRHHCMIITPLEAKEMYELTGYIPDFIKSDDLFL